MAFSPMNVGGGSSAIETIQTVSMNVGKSSATISNLPSKLKYVSFIFGTGGTPYYDGLYDVANDVAYSMRYSLPTISYSNNTLTFTYSALGGTSGYVGNAVIAYEVE